MNTNTKETKKNAVNYNKIDIAVGAFSAIGAAGLIRSLVKATVGTRNPILGLGFLTFEVVTGIKAFADAAYVSSKTRSFVKETGETVRKEAADAADNAEDDEEDVDNR